MTQSPQPKIWNIKTLLQWTAEHLAKAEVESPRLAAELLLAHTLNCKRLELYTRFDYEPDAEQLAQFKALIKRCAEKEPVQYLVGVAGFYSLEFAVNPAVLIPRPETEIIVTAAIDYLRINQIAEPLILDLCTGSGCIAGAVAKNHKQSKVIAVDICDDALQTARNNIEKLGLAAQVSFIQSDMFSNINSGITFDLLLSNPPYINARRMLELPDNVKYEPQKALAGGNDGLDFYKIIIEQGSEKIKVGGQLIIEIDHDQSPAICAMLEQNGHYNEIKVLRDNNKLERTIIATKK